MLEAALFPRKLASIFRFFYFCSTFYVGSVPEPEPECIMVPVPLRHKLRFLRFRFLNTVLLLGFKSFSTHFTVSILRIPNAFEGVNSEKCFSTTVGFPGFRTRIDLMRIRIRIPDPDPGSRSRIRIPDPDPGSGSRIQIPDPDPGSGSRV